METIGACVVISFETSGVEKQSIKIYFAFPFHTPYGGATSVQSVHLSLHGCRQIIKKQSA